MESRFRFHDGIMGETAAASPGRTEKTRSGSFGPKICLVVVPYLEFVNGEGDIAMVPGIGHGEARQNG